MFVIAFNGVVRCYFWKVFLPESVCFFYLYVAINIEALLAKSGGANGALNGWDPSGDWA